MESLDAAWRPITQRINRRIAEITPARELCRQLDGKSIAVRVRHSALAVSIHFANEALQLSTRAGESDPDLVVEGPLLTLLRLNSESGLAAFRDGTVSISGDAGAAQAFQQLLRYAKPDLEEELAGVVGDVAAHRVARTVRGLRDWGQAASQTMRGNLREYLQEESHLLPGRDETDRFAANVNALRNDVDRLAARIDRLLAGR